MCLFTHVLGGPARTLLAYIVGGRVESIRFDFAGGYFVRLRLEAASTVGSWAEHVVLHA